MRLNFRKQSLNEGDRELVAVRESLDMRMAFGNAALRAAEGRLAKRVEQLKEDENQQREEEEELRRLEESIAKAQAEAGARRTKLAAKRKAEKSSTSTIHPGVDRTGKLDGGFPRGFPSSLRVS